MNLLRSVEDEIRLDVPLPWNVYNADRVLILKKGYVLKKPGHIDMLLSSGMYVDNDECESGQPLVLDRTQPFNPLGDWEALYQKLGQVLAGRSESGNFVAAVDELVASIKLLTQKDTNAAIFLMVQLDEPRYAISHSLQTGFLCSLIAERLEWEERSKSSMIAAALTMDIAMVDLQATLSKQSFPPTEAQRSEIHSHPTRGRQRLEALGVTEPDWLTWVEEHHESADGKGYPRGTSIVSEAARIIRDSDRYWAMVSPHDNRKALPPREVARTLFTETASPQDSAAALIVRELGIYPPGSYVRLANGEQAVVTERGEKANTPLVCSFRGRDGASLIQPLRRKTSQALYAVAEPIPPDQISVAFNFEKLFGYGGHQL